MDYLFYILLGILPSIIWLLFYLRADVHPESNGMILKIFFYGMVIAIPAAIIEILVEFSLVEFKNIFKLDLLIPLIVVFDWFVVVAFTEEILKYLVVKWKVLRNSELDEPIDVMLYMIIAGLGFAALENIFLFLTNYPYLLQTVGLAVFRFISATFLHALSSALLGYFLALSFLNIKKRKRFLFSGILLAVFLHGAYNFSIIESKGALKVIIPVAIIVFLAFFVSRALKKLKKIKSVCKIK